MINLDLTTRQIILDYSFSPYLSAFVQRVSQEHINRNTIEHIKEILNIDMNIIMIDNLVFNQLIDDTNGLS